jgi:hypothetical protein
MTYLALPLSVLILTAHEASAQSKMYLHNDLNNPRRQPPVRNRQKLFCVGLIALLGNQLLFIVRLVSIAEPSFLTFLAKPVFFFVTCFVFIPPLQKFYIPHEVLAYLCFLVNKFACLMQTFNAGGGSNHID